MKFHLSFVLFKKFLAAILFLPLFFACKKESGSDVRPKAYTIKGKVEKGPFIKGSKVTIQELNKEFAPTGKTFNTTIIDDEGSFVLSNIELNSTLIEIITDGYFYNEVLGDLSAGPISLSGVADLSEGSDININILTHITKERILHRIKNEKLAINKAREKAQKEFFTIFGLQDVSAKSFNAFTITEGTREASSQIVVSSILLKDKSPAQFTEYMASLSDQFGETGNVSEQTKKELWEASVSLNYNAIKSKLIERYASLNKEINVMNLNRFVDWNNDGIAGNELGNIGDDPVLKFEKDTLKIGKEGGVFKIKITSNVPYKEYTDSAVQHDIFDALFNDIKYLQKTAIGNELTLSIAPGAGVLMKDDVFTIISYDNQTKASIVIQQEGDGNKINQDTKLRPYLSSLLVDAVKSMDLNFAAEAVYTHEVNLSGWNEFYQNAVYARSSKIQEMFERPYKAIRNINYLLAYDQVNFPPSFKASLTTLRSMLYYQMTVLWGNVFYVTSPIDISTGEMPKQIPVTEMYRQLEISFREGKDLLQSQRSVEFMPNAADIPKQMLARVLINQKKYVEALSLLEGIINSGRYSLVTIRDESLKSDNRELLYSLSIQDGSEYKRIYPNAAIIPVLKFSETLMLAVECAFHLGQNAKVIQYLNQIETGRLRNPKYTNGSSVNIQSILQTWKTELPGDFSYFDFLKRNALAESQLNLAAPYKLLLPIPLRELQLNPNAIQNPGY